MRNIYNCDKEKRHPLSKFPVIFAVMIGIITAVCCLHAYTDNPYVDFFPINGTFQNFNPVRRFLDGQLPYQDFQDYLGLGHLYSGTLFTALFGGDFKGSLIAFSFLTIISFVFISFAVGLAVFQRKENSILITGILLLLMLLNSDFLSRLEVLNDSVSSALSPGNSARYVRGMILPILVLMVWSGYSAYSKMSCKSDFMRRNKGLFACVGCGFLCGFAFAWSNDYGIACWVCMIVMVFWAALSRTRKLKWTLLCTGIAFISSVIGLFITIEIFTVGHFGEWFHATFGIGGYQAWYYNANPSFYIYSIDLYPAVLLQAMVCIAYMIKVFLDRASSISLKRFGIPAFMNMVCFCAVNAYRIMSGGFAREVSFAVLALTAIFELCGLLTMGNRKREKLLLILSVIMAVSWMWPVIKTNITTMKPENLKGTYIEALGGNLTQLDDDILLMTDILDGERIFSTYASAQEVVEDQYQPSGTDYIIHVLGDEQRAAYLDSFHNGDFKYAVTIRKELTPYEYWAERANWFLYRELYKNWHPVYANSYELYWERNTSNQDHIVREGFEVSTEVVDGSTIKVMVHTDETVNGIADVYIDYSVDDNADSIRSKLLLRKMLRVENSGVTASQDGYNYEINHLREANAEFIPIPIVQGYGEVTLSALPREAAKLVLKDVYCNEIYRTEDYIQTVNLTNESWSNGIGSDKATLLLRYSDAVLQKISEADTIRVGKESFRIVSIDTDENRIKVQVDKNAEACKFPALIWLENDVVTE